MDSKLIVLCLVVAAMFVLASSPARADKVRHANVRAFRLVEQIGRDYGIDSDTMIDKLGKNLVVGRTAQYTPLVAIEHIIRNVFEEGSCRTRYVCEVGSTMDYYRQHIRKQLDASKAGNKVLTALIHGVRGGDCDARYGFQCDPTLKEVFKSMQAPKPCGDDCCNNAQSVAI